jgi:hypothetical protein
MKIDEVISVKATGLYINIDDTNRAIEWCKDFHSGDYADVRIKLDGVELSFTLKDFKERLGFPI